MKSDLLGQNLAENEKGGFFEVEKRMLQEFRLDEETGETHSTGLQDVSYKTEESFSEETRLSVSMLTKSQPSKKSRRQTRQIVKIFVAFLISKIWNPKRIHVTENLITDQKAFDFVGTTK